MSIIPIVLYPEGILREIAAPVDEVNDDIRRILSDMASTMYEAPGIGLAAPQIGISKRLIVLDVRNDDEENPRPDLIKLINPEITRAEGTIDYEEGCLSIPGVREVVRRSAEVSVKGLNEHGKEIEIDASGLLAICLQHEIDHLNGVLFIDRLSKLKRQLVKNKLLRLASQHGKPGDE